MEGAQRRLSSAITVVLWVVSAMPAIVTAAEPIEVSDHRVEIGKGHVHCLVAGPKEGRPVVLLHGGRFKAATWRKTKTIDALARAGLRVIAVDLPGFGESPPQDVDRKLFLGHLLAKLTTRKAVVVSPSMSGRFSLPLVTASPKLVAGFVAVAPVGIPRHRDQLDKITVPTLLIWGEKDTVVPLEHAELLASKVKGSRTIVLPGARHPCYLDSPDRFNRELVAFVLALPDTD